jgi:predicted TIM-barrel fold metal-dependent hydrolase
MPLALFDFHAHVSRSTDARFPLLSDASALRQSLDEQGVSGRAISTPPEFLAGEDIERCNERIARTVQQDSRLVGLATVDAYGGERSARQLETAVRELKLRGVFVESARNFLLPNCAEAQPTLAAACSLGVPVFLHPVPDATLRQKFAQCGRMTERLSRSSINSAAVIAMLENGVFERHRQLKVVVTALALGGLLLAGSPPENLYIDTTGHDPIALSAAVRLFGPRRVIVGTDWPVVQEKNLPQRLENLLQGIGLGEADRERIASRNAKELLGL